MLYVYQESIMKPNIKSFLRIALIPLIVLIIAVVISRMTKRPMHLASGEVK